MKYNKFIRLCGVITIFNQTITPTYGDNVLREYWTGVSGSLVTEIPVTTTPSGSDLLVKFEATDWNDSSISSSWSDNYGQVLSSYLTVPETGSYTFWLSAGGASELYLSSDSSESNLALIANVTSSTLQYEWDLEASQKSISIDLEKGQTYLIKALHKEGVSADHMAVSWAKPGEASIQPSELIPGEVLSVRPTTTYTKVIIPDADATLTVGIDTDTNYGRSSTLSAQQLEVEGGVIDSSQSILRFDLSSLKSQTITNATLRLKASRVSTDFDDEHSISLIDDDSWHEYLITNTNKPVFSESDSSQTQVFVGEWIEFDVTDISIGELGGDGLLSLGLTTNGTSLISYHSKDTSNEDNRPQLVLSLEGERGLYREYFTNIAGADIEDIPLNTDPSGIDILPYMEATDWFSPIVNQNWADNYGQILTGYLIAPETGDYTFWVSSDGKSEVYLSTDETADNAQLIASVSSAVDFREWNNAAEQQSISISLTKDQPYFLQVYHKENDGDDHLSIAWARPGDDPSKPSEVIPESVIYPTIPLAVDEAQESLAPISLVAENSFAAASATLDGAVVKNNYTSPSGSYVDYRTNSGESVTWSVYVEEGGLAKVGFLYALTQNRASRSMAVEVNGVEVTSNLEFVPTGSWVTWEVLSIEVELVAGHNEISLISNGQSGPNVDSLVIEDVETSTFTWALNTGVKIQAEQAVLLGTDITNNHGGAEEVFYVDYQRDSGEKAIWSVTADQAGYSELSVRYTLGKLPPREMVIIVNDKNYFVDFTYTGGWANWASISVTVDLIEGENTIILQGIGESGANIDSISLSGEDGQITTNNKPFLRSINDGESIIAEGATNIYRDISFGMGIYAYETTHGIDANSVGSDTVTLLNLDTGEEVAGTANPTGGGDSVSFVPLTILNPNTTYEITVQGVLADDGTLYPTRSRRFTTGSKTRIATVDGLVFDKTVENSGDYVTSIEFTEDYSRLYAMTLHGEIIRWEVDPIGRLSNRQVITVGTDRTLIGLAFDPVVENRLWFTDNHTVTINSTATFTAQLCYIDIDEGAAFTGDVVVFAKGLPRSLKDHLVNSLEFGPDGFLYLTVGSLSAMGAADSAWGNKEEVPLSASLLKVNCAAIPPVGGFDVSTSVEGDYANGTYDPLAEGAPIQVYAKGVRNPYDLLWHSNGSLYTANNGSAFLGNSPDDPNTAADEFIVANFQQTDYLYKIKEGGYYGHPNPTQGKYIREGGNPTSAVDDYEVDVYAVGTLPDPDYETPIFDFGYNRSANGMAEYKSNAFNGVLQGALLVVEYSGGDRVVGLHVNNAGEIVSNFVVASGLTNPLDVIVHEPTGSLFVVNTVFTSSSQAQDNQIVRLAPTAGNEPNDVSGPRFQFVNEEAVHSAEHYVFQEVEASSSLFDDRDTVTVTIENISTDTLAVSSLLVEAPFYIVDNSLTAGFLVPSRETFDIEIGMNASGFNAETGRRVHNGDLTVVSNSGDGAVQSITLTGVWQTNGFGSSEPKVSDVMELYRWTNTSDGAIVQNSDINNAGVPNYIAGQASVIINNNVEPAYYFEAADAAEDITVTQIAAFHGAGSGAERFQIRGHTYDPESGDVNDTAAYTNGSLLAGFNHSASHPNTILPKLSSDITAPASCSIFYDGPITFEVTTNGRSTDPGRYLGIQALRVLEIYNQDTGERIENTYVMIMDYSGSTANFDYQDNIYIITNIKPFEGNE